MEHDELQEQRDDEVERHDLELERRDRAEDHTPTCASEGCRYKAVLGPYCAKHTGEDLRSRREGAQVKP